MSLHRETDEISPMLEREMRNAPESFRNRLAVAVINRQCDALVYDWTTNVQTDKIVYHGYYLDSIRAEGHGWQGPVYGANVVSDVPYGFWLEYGSPPHRVPLKPLREWAEWHGMTNPWAAAVGIQKKIAAKGTEPRPALRPAIASVRGRLRQIYAKALEDARR